MRADSGLVNYAPPRAIARRGGTFSVAATMQAHVRVAIEAIPNEQWTPILAVLAAVIALGTGFLGSFTTFSTWMVESDALTVAGQWNSVLLNIGGVVLGGLALPAAGFAAGSALI